MSEDFEVLSRGLRIQVDEAFDAALKSNTLIGLSSTKRSKSDSATNSGFACGQAGGFDIECDDPLRGFIPSKANNIQPSDDDLIPLSLIPSALQFLDLPPDDEDVLQVFYNAAGGWSGAPRTDGIFFTNDEKHGRTVTRKDWRAVCAVIIGDRKGEDVAGVVIDEEQTPLPGVKESSLQVEDSEDEKNGDEDEAYEESSLGSLSSGQASDSDFDEYTAEPPPQAKPKSRGRKSKHTSASMSYSTPTSRQKRASLDAFALFFPSSLSLTDDVLTTKRLLFKDIVRVAAILKETINAEEVCF